MLTVRPGSGKHEASQSVRFRQQDLALSGNFVGQERPVINAFKIPNLYAKMPLCCIVLSARGALIRHGIRFLGEKGKSPFGALVALAWQICETQRVIRPIPLLQKSLRLPSVNSKFKYLTTMLRRILTSRTTDGDRRRVWFSSKQQDLYVWYNETGEIVAFQLCYDKHHREHAIYWRAERGFAHLKVDGGEGSLRAGTPFLVADGYFDRDRVLDQFCKLATNIPEDIMEFVRNRMVSYSCAPDSHN